MIPFGSPHGSAPTLNTRLMVPTSPVRHGLTITRQVGTAVSNAPLIPSPPRSAPLFATFVILTIPPTGDGHAGKASQRSSRALAGMSPAELAASATAVNPAHDQAQRREPFLVAVHLEPAVVIPAVASCWTTISLVSVPGAAWVQALLV
jgi:hypothetical protein